MVTQHSRKAPHGLCRHVWKEAGWTELCTFIKDVQYRIVVEVDNVHQYLLVEGDVLGSNRNTKTRRGYADALKFVAGLHEILQRLETAHAQIIWLGFLEKIMQIFRIWMPKLAMKFGELYSREESQGGTSKCGVQVTTVTGSKARSTHQLRMAPPLVKAKYHALHETVPDSICSQ